MAKTGQLRGPGVAAGPPCKAWGGGKVTHRAEGLCPPWNQQGREGAGLQECVRWQQGAATCWASLPSPVASTGAEAEIMCFRRRRGREQCATRDRATCCPQLP